MNIYANSRLRNVVAPAKKALQVVHALGKEYDESDDRQVGGQSYL
jgi:hypothetical protein